VSDYPECDKMLAVQEQTQVIGEFLEWLNGQGVQLMVWREDLTDARPTDPECPSKATADDPPACKAPHPEGSIYGEDGVVYWRQHCLHWQEPEREATGNAQQGHCCRCQRGRVYEVHGIKAWEPDPRSVNRLLADWTGIGLGKIEAEKRAMLESLRAAG
jgi:hypothetical protein